MTTSELDANALDALNETSDNCALTTAVRLRVLNRAYRYLCKNSWVSYQPMGTFTIASGDETFNLLTKFALTGTEDVLSIERCFYLVSGSVAKELIPRSLGEIKGNRAMYTGDTHYPSIYALTWQESGPRKVPVLDIYPAVQNSGSGILCLDWRSKPEDLSATVDPITPSYADDALSLLAAAFMAETLIHPDRFEKRREAMLEMATVRALSFNHGGGRIESALAT